MRAHVLASKQHQPEVSQHHEHAHANGNCFDVRRHVAERMKSSLEGGRNDQAVARQS